MCLDHLFNHKWLINIYLYFYFYLVTHCLLTQQTKGKDPNLNYVNNPVNDARATIYIFSILLVHKGLHFQALPPVKLELKKSAGGKTTLRKL